MELLDRNRELAATERKNKQNLQTLLGHTKGSYQGDGRSPEVGVHLELWVGYFLVA